MIITRNGRTPSIASTAVVAPSAQVVGDVAIGQRCYIDYGVVIESGGEPVVIGDETIVLANSVIRSVGGANRPPFPVRIGRRTLIGPLCALAGCEVGSECYVATMVMIFQGAVLGDACRVAAGAIVHVKTSLPRGTHIGLRHIAVPTEEGFLATTDVRQARAALEKADFFGTVFDESPRDEDLRSGVMERLLREVAGWVDTSA